MTDKAKDALSYLRRIAREYHEDGLDMVGACMDEAADDLTNELRRCRAETLRGILNIAEGSTLIMALEGAQFVHTLRRMADEAEREAGDDE